MPDCAVCNRPLGKRRLRCGSCGACESCCTCEQFNARYDADELGLDPETDAEFLAGEEDED